VLEVCVCGGSGGRATLVEAPKVGCSRCCRGEVVPGLHLADRAGTAPPCLPGTRLGDW
jgi:hypothetical protein